MASMCSNPDCGNIRRVEGICPECGSPATDLGFKEGTALIKLKKENMNRKNDETAVEAQKIIDKMNAEASAKEDNSTNINEGIETVEIEEDESTKEEPKEDKPSEEVVKSSKGWINTIVKILVFVVFVIIFYIMFIYILN